MKNLARLLALALIVVMTLSLVGCGLASKIEGEWEATIEVEGVEADVTLEFDGDDEVKMTMSVMGYEETETSEYEIDGDELIIDDDEVDYEFEGNDTLILDMDELGEVEFERK